MGRKPSVRLKNGYWYSEAGGSPRYYGKIEEASKQEATARLWATLAALPDVPDSGPDALDASGLRDLFVEWSTRHRSPKTVKPRRLHLKRFVEFVGPAKAAASIDGRDVERWTAQLFRDGHHLVYVEKHQTSVRSMFRRGVRQGWIPPTVNPFLTVEPIRLPPRPLREEDLPTRDEIAKLFAHAEGSMRDMLTLFVHTGARTIEVAEMRVGDYQPATRTVVLGRHKRSNTMKDPTPRVITLNEQADEVLRRLTAGRPPEAPIILSRWKRAYRPQVIAHRFQTLRRQAGVRDTLTPYSFRHLLITDLLQAGIDSALVAKMCGTSTLMIAKVYAHWRVETFREAQAKLDALRARL